MKKLICIMTIIAVVVGITVAIKNQPAEAVVGPDQAKIAKFWIGQNYYEVNGKRREMDVAPYIKDGRTMMPARYLAESLGITDVKWFPDAQSVVINGKTDCIDMQVGRTVFGVNGWPVRGHFDVPPQIVPPGRVMIPYRAVAQALGALVFWDQDKKEITVMTWPTMPEPSKQALKKIVLYKDQATAEVTDMDGNTKTIKTDTPIMVTDERDGGFTLNAIEWFKLWGVPASSMLYDPERGGLAVRGASGTYPDKSAGFMYFYVGEKYAWDNAFNTTKYGPNAKPGENFVKDGKFYSGGGAFNADQNLFGRIGVGGVKDGILTSELQ